MARDCDEPERGEHAGEREQQRDPRCDERPERDEQDQERDRERKHPGLAQILAIGVHDGLLGTRVAHLADEEARMGCLRRRDRVDDRLDLVRRLVLRAGDPEVDEHRVPVLRDLRRLDLTDDRHLRDAGGGVLHDRVERGRAGPERLRSG